MQRSIDSLLLQIAISHPLNYRGKEICNHCVMAMLTSALRQVVNNDKEDMQVAKAMFKTLFREPDLEGTACTIAFVSSDGSLHRTRDEADLNNYRRAVEAGETTDLYEEWNERRKKTTRPAVD
jgi:hypothetical protein